MIDDPEKTEEQPTAQDSDEMEAVQEEAAHERVCVVEQWERVLGLQRQIPLGRAQGRFVRDA